MNCPTAKTEHDPIPKSLLEAELIFKIGQMKTFMDKAADIDEKVKDEILSAIQHLYQAKKLLIIEKVH
ncbi:hypothetical protein EDC14_100183 [Hydrogenispora ethanolica]|uniref:Uncharacterized protein n=1 Tax=Hydrogenispora ethanolica TaxID=1082276 RepID=A0A4R1SBC8_HYDET|nr:hypothetical protein [Hydrogenispora ethanolica]TCL76801.1 hypothetical protein EDC14_100183 [Hydrogenispora ethanolica]